MKKLAAHDFENLLQVRVYGCVYCLFLKLSAFLVRRYRV
jgi:hypothetical protein